MYLHQVCRMPGYGGQRLAVLLLRVADFLHELVRIGQMRLHVSSYSFKGGYAVLAHGGQRTAAGRLAASGIRR